jgi:hypothetical protein
MTPHLDEERYKPVDEAIGVLPGTKVGKSAGKKIDMARGPPDAPAAPTSNPIALHGGGPRDQVVPPPT